MIEEVWKPINGYEELYEVSNIGNVRSLDRIRYYNQFDTYIMKGKVLKLNDKHGYNSISICTGNEKAKQSLVHRLVADAFIPNPDNKPFVNHKNGIKNDNRVENLEWVTHKENTRHAVDVLNIKYGGAKGYSYKSYPNAKKYAAMNGIDEYYEFETVFLAANFLGVERHVLYNKCRNIGHKQNINKYTVWRISELSAKRSIERTFDISIKSTLDSIINNKIFKVIRHPFGGISFSDEKFNVVASSFDSNHPRIYTQWIDKHIDNYPSTISLLLNSNGDLQLRNNFITFG